MLNFLLALLADSVLPTGERSAAAEQKTAGCLVELRVVLSGVRGVDRNGSHAEYGKPGANLESECGERVLLGYLPPEYLQHLGSGRDIESWRRDQLSRDYSSVITSKGLTDPSLVASSE